MPHVFGVSVSTATVRKEVRGSHAPGGVLYGGARTAALIHMLGATKLPGCGPACSGPVPGELLFALAREAHHARLHPARAAEQ